MEEALTDYLLGASGLTAIVGQRITWSTRPQGSDLPAVVLTAIDALPDYTNGGPSGLVSSRIQIDCWGATYASSKTTARAVTSRLSGVDAIQGAVKLRGGFQQGERDSFERGQGGSELYRASLDFILWTSAA